MKNRTMAAAATVALASSALLLGHEGIAVSQKEKIVTAQTTQDVKVGEMPTVIVESDAGAVTLRTGADATARIAADKRAETQAILDKMAVSVDTRDNVVHVTYRRPEEQGRSTRADVHLSITAPASSRLQIHTKGGEIDAEGFRQGLEARTDGGTIRVRRVDGPLTLNTRGGSVGVEGAVGTVAVETAGGSITLKDRTGDDIRLRTGGGGITAEGVTGSVRAETGGGSIALGGRLHGENLARTGAGSVSVALANDSSLAVEASTSVGKVENDWGLPVEKHSGPGGGFRGSLGAGNGGHLRMTTGAGSISLTKNR